MINLIPIQFRLLALGIALVSAFFAGWKMNGWRHDSEYLARIEGAREALELTAKEIAKIEVQNTTIRQEVQTHVIEKPVYRDCRHDPDALRLLNHAITGKPGAGDSKLSGTDSVIGRFFWRNNDEAGGSGRPILQVP